MPYSITTKDGITINNIPDDVPANSQQLRDRVAKIRTGQDKADPDPSLGRTVGLTARNITEGAAGLVGTLVDPFVSAIGGAVRMATGNDYDPETMARIGMHVADALGLPKPETSSERISGALQKGLLGGLGGAGIANAVAKGTTGTTQAVAQMAASRPGLQAAAGAGAGAAGQVAQEEGASPLGQMAASLAGGIATPLALGAIAPAARSVIAGVRAPATPPPGTPPPAVQPMQVAPLTAAVKQAAPDNAKALNIVAEQVMPDKSILSAAKRLGIEDNLQPDHVTTNQSFRELSAAIKSFPTSELKRAEMEGLEEVAKRANRIVEEAAGSNDISSLSAKVQKQMAGTQEELSKKAEELYTKVSAAIPARTTVKADETLTFLKNHADDLGGAKRMLPVERNLLSSLGGDEPLTYAFLDQTRKQIGQALRKNTGPFANSESGMLKKMYSTLSDDQEAVANAAGHGDLFKAAKATVKVRKGLEDDMVSLFGKDLGDNIVSSLNSGMKNLSKGDTKAFVDTINAVPKNLRPEVAASGLNYAFERAGKMSFAKFADWHKGLVRNREAYNALAENLPLSTLKQLNSLAKVSDGIRKSTREFIATGRLMVVKDELKDAETAIGKLYDGVKAVGKKGLAAEVASSSLGAPGVGLATAVGAALQRTKTPGHVAADNLLNSSEFQSAIKAIANGIGRDPQRTNVLNRILQNSAPWKNYVDNLPQDAREQAARVGAVTWLTEDRRRKDEEARKADKEANKGK
ncbi:hypothetical protein [Pseudomonas sp.]|uniref:hypothetical protein n=1 Tax=Pseudomonas sp. TaxID=306 RepID=UPI003FD84104